MESASPRRFRCTLPASLGAACFLISMLAACASEPAFIAADYAKCQELGFPQGSREYAICLSEVQRQRTTLASGPEPITR